MPPPGGAARYLTDLAHADDVVAERTREMIAVDRGTLAGQRCGGAVGQAGRDEYVQARWTFEPHVAIASWDQGFLEVWTATQWPSAVRGELAHMFDTDPENVQVRVLPLGGGYGAKSQLKIEPTTCETSMPGVYAAGDVAGYPGKITLITICVPAAREMSVYRTLQTQIEQARQRVREELGQAERDLRQRPGEVRLADRADLEAIAQGAQRGPMPYFPRIA